MRYGSVCSGIEAATVAWKPLGWSASFFSEIDAFPRAVLEYHYPEVPLHGDFTTIQDGDYDAIDLLVGGTPCQSFSVAGLRKGLDDPRGNLMLGYGSLAQRLRPTWLVWENVPGVLSANRGRDFGTFLGMLAELGYGFAYRVLDAASFGVPGKRRRVFVVGYFGDWRPPAAVLFERESLGWNSKAGWRAGPLHPCLTASGARAYDDRTCYVLEKDGIRITTPLEHERVMGFPDGYTAIPQRRQAKAQPKDQVRDHGGAVRGNAEKAKQSVRDMRATNEAASSGSLPPDRQGSGDSLPPVQCEASRDRGYGLGNAGLGVSGGRIAKDGPRYKALGNSMAVPVIEWIGNRIKLVSETLLEKRSAA